MKDIQKECIICQGTKGDPALQRAQVWEDKYWRLTVSTGGEVLGFSYLEPKRHIPHITDLAGREAATLGGVLSFVTRALREETGAELVYIYVFGGGIRHLHIHLAPHRKGDALNAQILRGEVVEEQLESGATRMISKDFPSLPEEAHRALQERLRRRLSIGP